MGEAEPAAVLRALHVLGVELHRIRVRQGLSLRGMARRLQVVGHGPLLDFEHGRRLIPADLVDVYLRLFPDEAKDLPTLRDAVLAARAARLVESRAPSDPAAPATPPNPPNPPVAQLPADLADFVGREAELAELDSWVNRLGGRPTVVTVSGPPGMGKTSLALHFAHRVAADFPDAQLFVELHGSHSRPSSVRQVLGTALTAFGVSRSTLPHRVDERAALFRSMVAGKRILLILDDVADEAQVRPVLPGHSHSLVLITARGPLAGLDATYRLPLDALSPVAALALFGNVVGSQRVTAEPSESRQIVAHCGNLPLATRVAGALVATWPQGRMRDWIAELADRNTRLSRLRAGDRGVGAVFEMTYHVLAPPARVLFRRIALLPGPDFGESVVGVLADLESDEVDQALTELVRRGMVQAATAVGRYRLHDLLLLFAEQRLAAEETPDSRDRVTRTLLTHLLGLAYDASSTLDPSGYTTPGPSSPFRTREHATRWLDAERAGLVPAVRAAARLDLGELAFPLLASLPWYWDLRCCWEEWQEVNEQVLALAERLRAPRQQAIALNGLAMVMLGVADHPAAAKFARQALAVAQHAGATDEEAGALNRLGRALGGLGDHEEAESCFIAAIDRCAQLGDRWEQAAATLHLGEVLRAAGRLAEAVPRAQAAVTLFGELGSLRSQAMAYCECAEIRLAQRDLDQAAAHYRTALELLRSHDDDWGVARCRLGLGQVFAAAGDVHGAARELTEAVTGFAAVRDTQFHDAAQQALAALGRDRPEGSADR